MSGASGPNVGGDWLLFFVLVVDILGVVAVFCALRCSVYRAVFVAFFPHPHYARILCLFGRYTCQFFATKLHYVGFHL